MPAPFEFEGERNEGINVAEGAVGGEDNSHDGHSEGGLEDPETAFQLPLLPGFEARVDEAGAGAARFGVAKLTATGGDGRVEVFGGGADPKAVAGEEGVLKGGAGEKLEVVVGERVGLRSAHKFVGEVDAGDAFVVGGEGNGDAGFAVEHEGMVVALDVENNVVAGEVDFDHDVAVGHLLHELPGVVLEHDVDAMTDAIGVALLDGGANVEGEAFGWDQAFGELAGMQGDMHPRVETVQEAEHAHLPAIVSHGDVAVFGLDKVDADDVGVTGGQLEAEQRLREDFLGWFLALDLIEKADGHAAGGSGAGLIAMLEAVAPLEGRGEFGLEADDILVEGGVGKESGAKGGEVGVPAELVGHGADGGVVAGLHEFEILLVLRSRAGGDLVDPLTGEAIVVAEASEGVKEVIVAGFACGGDKGAHGESVDEFVVEVLIGGDRRGGRLAGRAIGFVMLVVDAELSGIHAVMVFASFAQKGLGVDRTAEVAVEVGPFWHAVEEGAESGGAFAAGFVKSMGGAKLGGRRDGLGDDCGE